MGWETLLSQLPEFQDDVRPCPRCGGDHAGLTFRRFGRPAPGGGSHWSTCPATGEPILLEFLKDAALVVECDKE